MEITIRARKEHMLSRFKILDHKSPFWLMMYSVSLTVQAYCNEKLKENALLSHQQTPKCFN